MQSKRMETNWAEENLQTIRTLMERSAVYRRALAPVMLICGIAGLAGGVAGWLWRLNSNQEFVIVWAVTAAFALSCSTLLVRQQALKEAEPFWSPPTRRIAQALTPPFFIGALVGTIIVGFKLDGLAVGMFCVAMWCWLFGCALHSAGFFMPRTVRFLGWLFIFIGSILAVSLAYDGIFQFLGRSLHLLMAAIFGGLHLACGVYLYLTESQKTAA
jgi:hypothetical protein